MAIFHVGQRAKKGLRMVVVEPVEGSGDEVLDVTNAQDDASAFQAMVDQAIEQVVEGLVEDINEDEDDDNDEDYEDVEDEEEEDEEEEEEEGEDEDDEEQEDGGHSHSHHGHSHAYVSFRPLHNSTNQSNKTKQRWRPRPLARRRCQEAPHHMGLHLVATVPPGRPGPQPQALDERIAVCREHLRLAPLWLPARPVRALPFLLLYKHIKKKK